MDQLVISGGRQLKGTIPIYGAKNATLPILAGCLLASEPVTLENVPDLEDIRTMLELLNYLGAETRHLGSGRLYVDPRGFRGWDAPYELVRKMRASFLILAPVLAVQGRSRVSLPGGCAIGSRPIDLHLKGLRALGAKIRMGYGFIEVQAEKLKGEEVYLDYPSVGATENLVMAACLAEGKTVITNCAQEPEVVDLANFLNSLGAKVRGAGSDRIEIEGVAALGGHPGYRIIGDRIEAGTYLAAAAVTGGEIELVGVDPAHLRPVLAKLRELGAELAETDTTIKIRRSRRLNSVDITTLPYPGFPTDLQPIFTAVCSLAGGVSVIRETVFENRFRFTSELARMGANIKIEGNVALVYGVSTLYGTEVTAFDLRGGAALVVAALAARGTTKISCLHHLDRGYADLKQKLRAVGAEITRVTA